MVSFPQRRSIVFCRLWIVIQLLSPSCQGFLPLQTKVSTLQRRFSLVPPADDTLATPPNKKTTTPLFPKVGDIVRYYDLDGGEAQGQVLVGKISFIQKQLSPPTDSSGWLVELTQLEDTGDGYYAEYPSRQRRSSKQALRDLAAVSPIAASWVRSEAAFKLPQSADGLPLVRAEQYDIQDYPGPVYSVDEAVVQADGLVYQELKGRLGKWAALAGFVGTLVTDLLKGTEDAAIYGAGVLASLGYLFFLSIKTDSIGAPDAKFGNSVSNVRFIMPVLVLVGIALYNQSLGEANPVGKTFDYVTTEQFAAAILGFLTYRIPLFAIQLQDSLKESDDVILPGSAGVALQLAGSDEKQDVSAPSASSLVTVLLVSGPQATGRSELVQRLVQKGQGRFVEPNKVDRNLDAATFERMEQRGEFLWMDPTARYGYTKDSILASSSDDGSVLVVDADVELAQKLSTVTGLRIVGVWVGLNSVQEFERRLEAQIESGEIAIPEDETPESVVRARIKEIVKEIEYGISSGIFEFTILNENEEKSIKQLEEAASYV